MPVGTVTLSPLRPHHAGEISKHSFISTSRPTVHNNPFRKQSFSTEPGEFQNAGFAFKAPSTLIRFQTKARLFCSVFKKICVQTYRFRIVFDCPHYNAVSVLKTLLYPRCACSNELDACAFQYIGPRNWRHSNLVPRAYVPFGQHQDMDLGNNQFPETKILGLSVSRRIRGLVYMASRDKVDVNTFHKGIQYALEKLGKSKFGFERNFKF